MAAVFIEAQAERKATQKMYMRTHRWKKDRKDAYTKIHLFLHK